MINERRARRYCYEDMSLIQNYAEAVSDTTQTWDIHHKVETIMNCGKKELIAQGCYYDRPAHELIFLTHAEHTRLHQQGKSFSAEHKSKLSESHKGKHLTLEHRANLSEACKGRHHNKETKTKIAESHKGKHLTLEHRAKIAMSKKGMCFSPEHKAKLAEAARRRRQRRDSS